MIPNTDDARNTTGLAIVPVKTPRGVRLYLYYFGDRDGYLKRAIRLEDGNWKPSSNAQTLIADPNSCLTATAVDRSIDAQGLHPDLETSARVDHYIMVYYIEKGKTTVTAFKEVLSPEDFR